MEVVDVAYGIGLGLSKLLQPPKIARSQAVDVFSARIPLQSPAALIRLQRVEAGVAAPHIQSFGCERPGNRELIVEFRQLGGGAYGLLCRLPGQMAIEGGGVCRARDPERGWQEYGTDQHPQGGRCFHVEIDEVAFSDRCMCTCVSSAHPREGLRKTLVVEKRIVGTGICNAVMFAWKA
ncbi:hypothetical protein A8D95_21050 [Burkholderia cenocepacia]|nr:hypothetical protein A8D83_26620 [Burkholderia cenocepacia]ONJ21480.1 hypothetical protein A8D90_21510 [Burkholderia cenocepacia]ONP30329.1 hypothetical protein A8D84_13585 [Burkholderia cenocepacia]ONP42662.1 hypothetical protein A8D85_09305 [Burkholderia cenocepacia]ONP47205.1 hypothetical protein A8D87_20005 [Burkholderia cenocepacia]